VESGNGFREKDRLVTAHLEKAILNGEALFGFVCERKFDWSFFQCSQKRRVVFSLPEKGRPVLER